MELFLANVQGIAGFIAGIGTFLSGLAALITAVRKRNERKEKNVKSKTRFETVMWLAGSAMLVTSLGIFAVRAAQSEKAKNELLVDAAWRGFKSKGYQTAIAKCTELIDEFRASADREQAALDQKKAPQPSKGKPQQSEKNAIFERGLLNDVATCYFIVGRSSEYQGRNDLARDAYSNAARYTYARTWDPKGWFWSPAEASLDRLSDLK